MTSSKQDRAEAAHRLVGIVHDGDWFHISTPRARTIADRALV
jgi:hypothetical protein